MFAQRRGRILRHIHVVGLDALLERPWKHLRKGEYFGSQDKAVTVYERQRNAPERPPTYRCKNWMQAIGFSTANRAGGVRVRIGAFQVVAIGLLHGCLEELCAVEKCSFVGLGHLHGNSTPASTVLVGVR